MGDKLRTSSIAHHRGEIDIFSADDSWISKKRESDRGGCSGNGYVGRTNDDEYSYCRPCQTLEYTCEGIRGTKQKEICPHVARESQEKLSTEQLEEIAKRKAVFAAKKLFKDGCTVITPGPFRNMVEEFKELRRRAANPSCADVHLICPEGVSFTVEDELRANRVNVRRVCDPKQDLKLWDVQNVPFQIQKPIDCDNLTTAPEELVTCDSYKGATWENTMPALLDEIFAAGCRVARGVRALQWQDLYLAKVEMKRPQYAASTSEGITLEKVVDIYAQNVEVKWENDGVHLYNVLQLFDGTGKPPREEGVNGIGRTFGDAMEDWKKNALMIVSNTPPYLP